MYPFRMYGRIIELYRYRVDYSPGEDGEQIATAITERFPTAEEAQAVADRTGGTLTPLDTAANEWLDGIEVADVPDTFGEAVRIYEMGEAAYRSELDKLTPEQELAAMKANWETLLGGTL